MRLRYLPALLCLLMASACTKSPNSEVAPATATDSTSFDALDYVPQVCIDKRLNNTNSSGIETDAVIEKRTKWANGKQLKIYFLNGATYYQDKVMKFAKVWSSYANITFVKTTSKSQSDIRVGFKWDNDEGSWSYVGTDNSGIGKSKETMNFGWFDKKTTDKEFSRVITHEFGHAIGLVHEHSSPVAAIKWNQTKVYKYYEGAPNYWSKEAVDDQIFYKYSVAETQYTTFDPTSIMEYPVDAALTTDHKAIGYNYYLSATDKSFIAKIYPKKSGVKN